VPHKVPLLLTYWAQSCALSPPTEHSCGGSVLHKNKNAENGRTAILIADCELPTVYKLPSSVGGLVHLCTLVNSSVHIPCLMHNIVEAILSKLLGRLNLCQCGGLLIGQ